MKSPSDNISFLIPSSLLMEVEEAAQKEHRQASDIVREALECYLGLWRIMARTGNPSVKLNQSEAVAQLLKQREHNVLPDGVSIKDLITYGRA